MKKAIIINLILLLVSFTISHAQLFKTSLKLTVRNELGNAADSAAVKIFETKNDYLKEVNVVAEAVTNSEGVVKFKDLKPIQYFILVRKKNMDNIGGGEKIGKLVKGRFNKSTVVIQ